MEECIKASQADGETVPNPVPPRLRGWFVQHLAVMLTIHLLPATPVIDYGLPREKLVEQAVCFCLRGIGLTDEAIKRYYNPKALALMTA
jgi:hypothetical protein